MNANIPSSNLAPPPKFASLSTGQGPATVDDWMQFIRWLYQLYGRTVENINAPQSIAFNAPSGPAISADAIVAQAQVLRQGPIPGRAASEAMLGAPPPPQHANELDALVTLALTRNPQRNPSLSSLVIEDTHSNRSLYPATSYSIGTLYWETDRTVWYLVALVGGVNVWIYASGEFRDVQASLPSDLGVNDAGFLFQVSDYNHRLRWSGTIWGWAGGEIGSCYMQLFEVDPSPAAGWHLYDGSTVNYLRSVGTLGSVTLPDLTSTAAKAAYPKAGSADAGPTAAIAPTFAGTTDNTGVNTMSILVIPAPTGLSDFLAGDNHTHPFTPAGTVSATGEPRSIERRPFFRM
jgi:hypothetical protein